MTDVNILLYDEFETLDAFGPAEVFGRFPKTYLVKCISMDGGMVTSRHNIKVQTDKAAELSGILLIPGGMGSRVLINNEVFIARLSRLAQQAAYCLCVCTGSALLAKTGLLDSKKATSNKMAFDFAKGASDKVDWIQKARWVTDGKYYTSSGVSAGIDMSLGFISDMLGENAARLACREMEYMPNLDKDNDPFFLP